MRMGKGRRMGSRGLFWFVMDAVELSWLDRCFCELLVDEAKGWKAVLEECEQQITLL